MNRCALISAAWRCTVSECFSFCLTVYSRRLDMTGVFRGFFCDLIPLTIRLRLIFNGTVPSFRVFLILRAGDCAPSRVAADAVGER